MILTQKMQAVRPRWEADGKLACKAKVSAIYFLFGTDTIPKKNPNKTLNKQAVISSAIM